MVYYMTNEKQYKVDQISDQIMSDLSDWHLTIIRDALTHYLGEMSDEQLETFEREEL